MKPLQYTLIDKHFQVSCLRQEETQIGVGEDAFAILQPYFADCPEGDGRHVVIITDTRVWEIHGALLQAKLASMRIQHRVCCVPSGEASKSLTTLHQLWEDLAVMGAKRRTMILALGGGVICDMAGFVAATYMRGIPYINIPTTLIAQIDAAIGGKVAVDTAYAKNALGAFYHPRAVIVWPGFLKTLPLAEVAAGMAEVIKVAVLASPDHFAEVESLGAISTDTVARISDHHLARWIQTKLDFLALDPFEVGSLDRALNFGHAFAHAIESATQYRSYRHGEAVAIGMAMACRIAVARGILVSDVAGRIIHCIQQNNLPTEFPKELENAVWQALDAVRNIRNGELREVLPVGLGVYHFVKDVSHAEYVAARVDSVGLVIM